jgi:2-polyprenyl-3-methyl-5-hydroxy-6-metoxy-1,4-benzoquinol methylase
LRSAVAFGPSRLVACRACRTQFLSPQPTQQRLNEIYGPAYYSPWSSEDEATIAVMKLRTFRPLLDACQIEPGMNVLDVGCATGSLLAEVAERRAVPFGIDLQPQAIEDARRRVPKAHLHAGQTADHPFPTVEFDAVLMIDLLEHVREPASELRVVRERMRARGRLVISTPRVDSTSRRVMRRFWPQYREEHLTYFSRAGIEQLLARCGFELERITSTKKAVSLAYAYGQMRAYPVPVLRHAVSLAYSTLPPLRHRPYRFAFGEMTVIAVRQGT